MLDHALDYAAIGWPIFPCRADNKKPLNKHGLLEAVTDVGQIRAWWARWPKALIGLATGPGSGIVALDVDIDAAKGIYGPDSLEGLGVSYHPETPTSHTPRGGYHVLFKHPGHHLKTTAGKLGIGLDIRGDGGYLVIPPGPGRFWDPIYGRDYPLADMPDWLIVPDPPAIDPGPAPILKVELSRYAEAAIDNAVRRIAHAPAGQQAVTLNAEAYGIGRLAGGEEIPSGFALDALIWAGLRMPSHDSRNPWRRSDIVKRVKEAFTDGLARPRRRP